MFINKLDLNFFLVWSSFRASKIYGFHEIGIASEEERVKSAIPSVLLPEKEGRWLNPDKFLNNADNWMFW